MAHPHHHAESSARKFGGVAEDYAYVHDWFDLSKAWFSGFTHRALRHHAQGIFEAVIWTFKCAFGRGAARDRPTDALTQELAAVGLSLASRSDAMFSSRSIMKCELVRPA